MSWPWDWVKDAADELIDFGSDVLDFAEDVIAEIARFAGLKELELMMIVLVVVVLCTGGFASTAVAINANTAALAAEGASYWTLASATIGMYAEALYLSFVSFLTAIHFSTLLSIHAVAYLVSEDYRIMIHRFYGEIARVSGALDLGTVFLLLAHRNARNIVLDASTMMGLSYDIGEIVWLNQYMDYLRKFNERASKYQNNPGAVLYDIDELLIKPSTDLKAGIMSQVLTSIDAAVGIITTTVTDITTLRNDFGQLLSDLPAQIRDKITPYVDDIFDKYDTWIRDDYRPAMHQFDDILDALGRQHIDARITVAGLIDRLKNPVDYLKEIDWLGPDERAEQEEALYELATRPLAREISETTRIAESVSFEMQKMLDALEYEAPPPAWYREEIITPARPADVPVVKRKTWFVGDF